MKYRVKVEVKAEQTIEVQALTEGEAGRIAELRALAQFDTLVGGQAIAKDVQPVPKKFVVSVFRTFRDELTVEAANEGAAIMVADSKVERVGGPGSRHAIGKLTYFTFGAAVEIK